MELATIPGRGFFMPDIPQITIAPNLSSAPLDAAGRKFAFVGTVWNKEREAKTIVRVGFLFGTVTKSGGSGLTVSLQDPTTTTGPPIQPDGTMDQSVAVANGDTAFASNTWYRTAAFTPGRSVAFGELLSVVIEFDGAGRLGSDVVNINALNSVTGLARTGGSYFTSSWAAFSVVPSVILEFSDGTFGTLDNGMPCSATGTVNFNLNGSPDEYCLEFTLPGPVRVDGAWVCVATLVNTRDFEVILYDGDVALQGSTVYVDANVAQTTLGRTYVVSFGREILLSANKVYRLAVRQVVNGTIALNYLDVADAAHLQAHSGGASWCINSRTDLGAWNGKVETRRPFMGIRVSSMATLDPSIPGLCKVYGYRFLNGSPLPNVTVNARLRGNVATDQSLLSSAKTYATTDSNGYWELYLVQKGEIHSGDPRYEITVTDDGVETVYLVAAPNISEVNIAKLL